MLNFLLKAVCSSKSPPSPRSPPEEPRLDHPTRKKSSQIHITDSQKTRFSLHPISTQLKRTIGRVSIISSTSEMPLKKENITKRVGTPAPKEMSTSTKSHPEVVASLMSGLDQSEDYMTGQDPSTSASLIPPRKPIPKASPPSGTVLPMLIELGDEFLRTKDSLSPKIMTLIDDIDKGTGPLNPTLRSLYVKMIGLLRDDFWQTKGLLQDATKYSFNTLYMVVRSIITTYQIATARDIGAHLSDISAMRDDMVAKAKEMEIQEHNNRTFLESMTKSWNTLAKNITSYNEILEKKILESSTLQSSTRSHLQATPKNTASSSTSRAETPLLIPGMGKTYKGKAGVVRFITERQVSLNIQSSTYKNLKHLETIDVGPKIWTIILNFDLNELNSLLNDRKCCLYDFPEMSNPDKLACILQLQEVLLSKANQWTEIE